MGSEVVGSEVVGSKVVVSEVVGPVVVGSEVVGPVVVGSEEVGSEVIGAEVVVSRTSGDGTAVVTSAHISRVWSVMLPSKPSSVKASMLPQAVKRIVTRSASFTKHTSAWMKAYEARRRGSDSMYTSGVRRMSYSFGMPPSRVFSMKASGLTSKEFNSVLSSSLKRTRKVVEMALSEGVKLGVASDTSSPLALPLSSSPKSPLRLRCPSASYNTVNDKRGSHAGKDVGPEDGAGVGAGVGDTVGIGVGTEVTGAPVGARVGLELVGLELVGSEVVGSE